MAQQLNALTAALIPALTAQASGGQMDPITVQRMMEIFPTLQRAKRKGERAKEQKKYFDELARTPGKGNYVPTQKGGLYETVAQYQPDYAGMGNTVAGVLGSYLTGREAEAAEDEYETGRSGEILGALEQMGQPNQPEGGATTKAMRGYLGLLGAKDLGIDTAAGGKVRSTQRLANGNLALVTDEGIEDTGMPYDYGIQVVTGAGGQQIGIGKSGAGRGLATDVRYGDPAQAGGADAGATAPSPVPGAPKVSFEQLTPEQNRMVGQIVAGMPPEQADAFINQVNAVASSGIFGAGASAAPGGQQGAPVRVPTKAEEAGSAEAAKIAAQVAAAPQVAQTVAAEKGLVADAETAAKARAALPGAEEAVRSARLVAGQLLQHPGLSQIVGGMGGRIPDGPTATAYFNAIMAGTPAADAMALHQQAKGKVFMGAYESLKGAGQITQQEEASATAALARINRAQTKQAYVKAVNEFLGVLDNMLVTRRTQAQGGYGMQPNAPAPAAPTLPPGWKVRVK